MKFINKILTPFHYSFSYLGLKLLRLIVYLPYAWQLKIGEILGKTAYYLAPSRKRITHINLKLCFPELNDKERKTLALKCFASVGMGVIEAAMSWWLPEEELKSLITVNGIEHAISALQKGKGVLIVGLHFTCLELIGRLIASYGELCIIYRQQKNSMVERILGKMRNQIYKKIISRENVREIYRSLQQNYPVWYAADQDYGRKHSEFVPFFSIQTAFINSLLRIAKTTNASVIPTNFYRRSDKQGYVLDIYPALENFPSGDNKKDLAIVSRFAESCIRAHPEQYLWLHRRFKTRPLGEKHFYK